MNGFCDCGQSDDLGMYVCEACQEAMNDAVSIESEAAASAWELKQALIEALRLNKREQVEEIIKGVFA